MLSDPVVGHRLQQQTAEITSVHFILDEQMAKQSHPLSVKRRTRTHFIS